MAMLNNQRVNVLPIKHGGIHGIYINMGNIAVGDWWLIGTNQS